MIKTHPAELKEFTLKTKHTHAGKELLPGAKIHLTARQAAFIAPKLEGARPTTEGESK